MSGSEVFWLNVANAVLGILVLLPVLALLIAILFEIGKSARRRIAFYVRLHLDWHHLAHLDTRR